MSNIERRAILSAPTIKVWTARRRDRIITDEVADRHNVLKKRAGNYNKCLIDVEAPSYKSVKALAGEARKYHYKHTLPWSFEGACILSTTMFEEYAQTMREFERRFTGELVPAFKRDFPHLVAAAKRDLNGMFRQEDYPSAAKLDKAFGFEVRFYPVPNGNDVRVDLDATDVAAIKSQVERDVLTAERAASTERWTRLHSLMTNLVDILSNDRTVRDSLVGNLQEAVDILPKLALSDDPQFDAVIAEVRRKVSYVHPQALRDDEVLRSKIAADANAIAKKMAKYAAV